MIGIGVRMAVRRIVRDRRAVGLLAAGLACGLSVLTLAAAFAWTVLMQPFPFPDADRIVRVFETVRRDPDDLVVSSVPIFEALEEEGVLEDLSLLRPFESAVLTTDGSAVQLGVSFVVGRDCDLLGATPVAGRLPSADELAGRANPNVVLLEHGFWLRDFGGDPSVVGRSVDIAGTAHEIVGVAAPSVVDISSAFVEVDAWLPAGSAARPYPDDFRSRPDARYFHIYGRLRGDAGLASANETLDALSRRLAAVHVESHGESGLVGMPLRERFLGDVKQPAILVLSGAAFLLLVAWINALSLTASRASRIAPQMWIQLAVGGTRRDVLRGGLVEYGLVLGVVGIGTIVLSRFGLSVLERTAVLILPAFMTVRLPPAWPVVVGLTGVAVLGTLVAGPGGSALARVSGAGRAGSGRGTAASLGLGVQVGVATSLALGAVVLGLSVRHLGTLERGYEPRGVPYYQTDLGAEAYPGSGEVWTVARGIDEQLADAVPEVTAASVWSPAIPGWSGNRTGLVPEGGTAASLAESVIARYHSVGAGALDLLRIEVVRGRGIEPSDGSGATPVAVVSETAAQLLWPGLDPMGRRFRRFQPPEPGEPVWFEVVGVTRDAPHSGRNSGNGVKGDIYLPYLQV